jgi:hypothetical protein
MGTSAGSSSRRPGRIGTPSVRASREASAADLAAHKDKVQRAFAETYELAVMAVTMHEGCCGRPSWIRAKFWFLRLVEIVGEAPVHSDGSVDSARNATSVFTPIFSSATRSERLDGRRASQPPPLVLGCVVDRDDERLRT